MAAMLVLLQLGDEIGREENGGVDAGHAGTIDDDVVPVPVEGKTWGGGASCADRVVVGVDGRLVVAVVVVIAAGSRDEIDGVETQVPDMS